MNIDFLLGDSTKTPEKKQLKSTKKDGKKSYNDVVKDLLKTTIEIYGLTKSKLGINSELLFMEFEQFKSNQQYDLMSKVDFDEWLDKKAQKLINDISSRTID